MNSFFIAFNLDRNIQTARTYAIDTIPTTPTIQSRRVSFKGLSIKYIYIYIYSNDR